MGPGTLKTWYSRNTGFSLVVDFTDYIIIMNFDFLVEQRT